VDAQTEINIKNKASCANEFRKENIKNKQNFQAQTLTCERYLGSSKN
jgi:hypothetical protein